MMLNRTLLIGSLLALVLGVAVSTLVASTDEKPNPSPITVPIGRVGDRVVYAYFAADPRFESAHAAPPSEVGVSAGAGPFPVPSQPDKPASPQVKPYGPRAWEVKEVRGAFDAAHEQHRAILTIHNETIADDPNFRFEVVEYVDAEVRETFRQDTNTLSGDGRSELKGGVTNTIFAVQPASLPGIAWQGATLRLGEILEDRAAPEYDHGGFQGSHIKAWVRDRQVINGHDAYAVVREMSAHAATAKIAAPDSKQPSGPRGEPQRVEVRLTLTQVQWMSADFAYAVFQETSYRAESEGRTYSYDGAHEFLVLQRVDVGQDVLPWGPDGAAHFAGSRSDLERTPASQSHPDDGAGSSLAYSLRDAVANVQGDLRLIQFRVWSQAHPNAFIAGAQYGVGEHSSTQVPTVAWQLLFLSPDGASFTVTTERFLASQVVTNSEAGGNNGERKLAPLSASDLPARPPTLGALERTWGDYVSAAARAQPFDYVRWGLEPADGNQVRPCARGYPQQVTAYEGYRFVYEGGHSATGSCLASSDRGTDSSSLSLDPASGLVNWVLESKFRYTYNALNLPFGAGAKELPRPEPATIPAGLSPPPPTAAATTSSGFLAAFLALYFWPTLKFLGLKALIVGGYAKIGRERVLESPVREQMLHLIRENPGIHASELARQIQVGWGTIVYHLSVLERNRLVTSLVDGRHKRFFPADTVDFSKRGQLAALRNATSKQIYELIEGEPGFVQGDLARRTNLTVPTVIWHLRRLETAGLVGRDKSGRRYHYYANPAYEPKKADEGHGMEVA